MEEILKLLKPILDAIMDTEVASDELFNKAVKELGNSIDESRYLFESWHPLASRVDFVLQAESLTGRIRKCVLEFFWLLKDSRQSLPVELNSSSLEEDEFETEEVFNNYSFHLNIWDILYASLFLVSCNLRISFVINSPDSLTVFAVQHCILKAKNIACDTTSTIINDALQDQEGAHGPSPEELVKIADCLGLRSNQEILIEAVALEKLKENAEQAEKNAEVDHLEQLISLVTRMHDRLVMLKQCQSCTPVPIPADFCCPLSLELMTDPVIVSSGQTYERAFIRKWLDLGLTVCPKTRQSLVHTNLIPNYTVKALIANWCEINNVKLPDPMKSINVDQPLALLSHNDSGSLQDSQIKSQSKVNYPGSPESMRSAGLDGKNASYSSDRHRERASSSHPRSSSDSSMLCTVEKEHGFDISRVSLEDRLSNSERKSVDLNGQHHVSPARREYANAVTSREQPSERNDGISVDGSRDSEMNLAQRLSGDADQISQSPGDSREVSGELSKEPHTAAFESTSRREPDYLPRPMDSRSRNQNIWRRPSDRFVPRLISSPTIETRPDLSETEAEVKKLVDDLKSDSIDTQREATAQLRLLAKHNMDNRIVIANCGAISLLVELLQSTDPKTQENAVTALLNLSINDNNKITIANADAIEPLIHVLQTGTHEARENSAATLFSLSVIEENKSKIGRSGAIGPLVELLGNGTPRGKKDAATALFNLSIYHENKARIMQAGAVKHLVELMDPAVGMVDKAVAVLANLATIPEGRTAIGQAGGIPVLVEVVELGSARGKENAAAALLQLCTYSSRFCNMVLQEGAVPPLVALSQSGTPRAREKAQSLLSYFRNQRHANSRG
ncbi:U-box domain-containing protein 4 [Bienertia sinuspersici]